MARRGQLRWFSTYMMLACALLLQRILAQEESKEAKGAKGSHEATEASHEDEATEAYYTAIASVVTITALIFMSIVFETASEHLKESTEETNMPFISTIFSELTTLGFIGSVLFVVSKSGYLEKASVVLFGEDKKEELQETVEMLHMALFLFVIIFLLLCIVLLKLGTGVQNEWREFERRSPYLPVVVSDFCLATEPPTSFWEKFNYRRLLEGSKRRREMVYLSLRRRFVDVRSNHPDPLRCKEMEKEYQVNQNIRFPFNEYLSIISGEVMARLIEIDVITWVALEVFIVCMLFVCWQVGPEHEVYVLVACGILLIFLNQVVYGRVRNMRKLLTPPKLFRKAERRRLQPDWRRQNQLVPAQPLSSPTEKSPLLLASSSSWEKVPSDSNPPYLAMLPNGGMDMDYNDLTNAQKKLLGGGNGVLLAMFSTRMVFLLTALHLSVFLVRTMGQIHTSSVYPWWEKVILYVLLALPSCMVTSMSTIIARDGLYSFNVEHMKVPRVINKVMRILKARSTLRTLRFIAEMKVYLREDHKKNNPHLTHDDEGPSHHIVMGSKRGSLDGISFHAETQRLVESPTKNKTSEALSKHKHESPSVRMQYELPMSPLSEPPTPKRKLSTETNLRHDKHSHKDKYEEELERREIGAIFELFDRDVSGSISRNEMQTLLQAISSDMTMDQINRIMIELDENHTGEVQFEAFYNWCRSRIHEHSSSFSKHELIHEVFNMIDTDRSGFITVDEFISIFSKLGQSLDHDDVRELIYQMDSNDDGKIDLEEFSKMLHKHAV
ncbi:hypothetical protein SDRG_03902 [Saprolegnia diclina VS20]|uniref:Calmodulin n=1 Tax=Saprolegnia diclina (strain VS20) TaxID=1156394 RepID=T0S813_SAPDV|nr:hypothetical protein SDRG_03902 [Saprolegnia diclina VS20]EQC38947.1 hypothetical protein SDRG_03902 [Saprolegnia diclina VS20]|eukprot:XP_008607771.1 hypothetical protein SDRG_03902 [Saprolegnia diclina VS20]